MEKQKEQEKEEEGGRRIGRRRRGRCGRLDSSSVICPWGFSFPPQSHLAVLLFDLAISSLCLQLYFESSLYRASCIGLPPPWLISGGAFGWKGMLFTHACDTIESRLSSQICRNKWCMHFCQVTAHQNIQINIDGMLPKKFPETPTATCS